MLKRARVQGCRGIEGTGKGMALEGTRTPLSSSQGDDDFAAFWWVEGGRGDAEGLKLMGGADFVILSHFQSPWNNFWFLMGRIIFHRFMGINYYFFLFANVALRKNEWVSRCARELSVVTVLLTAELRESLQEVGDCVPKTNCAPSVCFYPGALWPSAPCFLISEWGGEGWLPRSSTQIPGDRSTWHLMDHRVNVS